MGKEYLIDTNAVIDYLDNKLPNTAAELIDSIEASEVISLEEPVILKAIEIRKAIKTKLPDAIIAATAIVHKLTLITRNTKDFERIEGLEILDSYTT